jgi:hypothetical protein
MGAATALSRTDRRFRYWVATTWAGTPHPASSWQQEEREPSEKEAKPETVTGTE